MGRTTLAGRIFVALAATLAVLFAAAALTGASRVRSFHREEVERRLGTAAALLDGLARSGLKGEIPQEALQEQVRGLRLDGDLRVTVVADDGTVIADGVAALPLENHARRPEILEARVSGSGTDARSSASTGSPTLYLARRIDDGGGTLGFVRVAETLQRAEEEVASFRNALLLGGAVVLVLGLAASALVARWIARPLRDMERDAAALASGAPGVRVEAGGPVEVARLAGSLNRMAEEVRRRVEAERKSRAELEAVLAGMAEGVVAVDATERILFMNAAAARLLGLAVPLPPGTPLREAVPLPDLRDLLGAAVAGGSPDRSDAPSPAGDGRTVEVAAGPLGPGAGAVAVLRDVSEVRRLEHIRMDFVANVSHELRTPLAGVAGALETLEDDLDARERRRFLDIARRNTERMTALVSDLLDLSAIEGEESSMALEPVPLDRLVRSATASLVPAAQKAGVALGLEPPSPGDLLVRAHPRRLEQAFVNLVENAIKYTPAGGRITVRVVDRGVDLAVEVEDTGVGMPAAAIPRIFERFYRVDPSRSRAMGGTGLGLAIVKHVVRAHRGRVEVRSTEGAGSTFRVVLPRFRPE